MARDAGNGWHMRLDELDVPFITPRLPCCILIDLVIPIDHGSPGTNAVLQTALTVYTDDRYIMGDTVYLPFLMQYNSASPVEGVPTEIPPPGVQFSYELRGIATQIGSPAYQAYGPGISHQQQTVMPLSQALYDRIVAYGASIEAMPPADSRNYPRMLYFSTGVATFGGSGEPVPASTLATLLVFVEAIGAVLLIGLFVNSLVYEAGERSRGTLQTGESRIVRLPNRRRSGPRSALRKPRTRNRERGPGDGACQAPSRGKPLQTGRWGKDLVAIACSVIFIGLGLRLLSVCISYPAQPVGRCRLKDIRLGVAVVFMHFSGLRRYSDEAAGAGDDHRGV